MSASLSLGLIFDKIVVVAATTGGLLLIAAIIYAVYIAIDQYVHVLRDPKVYPKEPYPLAHTILLLKSMAQCRILETMQEWTFEWPHTTFSFRILGQPRFYMTYDPQNIQHVLKDAFDKYGKGPIFRMKAKGLLGDGIFNVDGKAWYIHRKVSAHLFNVRLFKTTILSTFLEHADILEHMLKTAKPGTVHDMHDLFHRFTLDSIGKIAFGVKIGSLEDASVNFARSFDYVQALVNQSFLDPFWLIKRLATPQGWLYYWHLYKLNKYAYGMVQQRRQDREVDGKGDILSLFLSRQEAVVEESELTDKYLRDVVINFIIAGRDTTAQALSWAFYTMATMPEIQQKVRDEVNAVTDPLPEEEKFTYESIQQMKYTEAFVMEVLRLYPSVPKEVKYAFEDDVLPDGTKVSKGSWVAFVPWVMGRHPALWEDPTTFDPTRFLNNSKPSPYKYIAFQAGPRTCLGQNLALLEAKCVIARLVQKFQFSLAVDKSRIHYKDSLTLPMQDGLPMRVEPIH